MATLNIQGARKAGWSDEKIQEYLKQRPDVQPSEPISQPKQPLHEGEFSTGIDVAMRAGQKQPVKQKSFFSRLIDNTVPALKEFGGTVVGMGVGAAKGVGSTVAGATELVGSGLQGISNVVTGQKEKFTRPEFVQKAVTPTTPEEQIGFGAEQLAEYFIPGGAVTKGVKAVQAAKALKSSPKLAKALGLLTAGVGEAAGAGTVQAVQSGKINEETARAAKYGGAGGIVSGLAKMAGTAASRGILRKLVPTTPTLSAKDAALGIDVAEAVEKTGVSLTKQSMQKKLGVLNQSLGKKLGNLIDAKVKQAPKETYKITDVTAGLKDKVLKDPDILQKLGATPVDMKDVERVIDNTIKKYNNLPQYKGKNLTYNDLQKLKVDLGGGLFTQFEKAPLAPIKAKPATEIKLRSTLREILEEGVPGAGELNKQLAPIKTAITRLKRKGVYSTKLLDTIFGVGGASILPSVMEERRDLPGVITGALSGLALRRGISSTLGKTLSAKIVRDLPKILTNPAVVQKLRESMKD